MPKYKLTIAYDGTAYGGWQVQLNAVSIQTLVQKALQIALRTPIDLTGAGRTDAGVHALGQVAHFSIPNDTDIPRLLASLNGLLPLDIRIRQIESVAENFHARYSAEGKVYRYHLHFGTIAHPFKRLYAYHVPHPVDLELLKKGADLFVGERDFTSFANEAREGSAAKNPIRTLRHLDLVSEPEGFYLEFEGDGFLYRMVRNITGTLLDVSCGKIALEDIPKIFAAKDRRKAGKTAPPHGLFLVKVNYV